MKQTAVEWLQEQLKKGIDYNPLDKNSYLNNVEKLFEKAKEIEENRLKEVVISTFKNVPTVKEIKEWAKEQAKIEPTGAEEFGRIWGAIWMREFIEQDLNTKLLTFKSE